MSNKDLIMGFLLGKDAPPQVIAALDALHEEMPDMQSHKIPESIRDWDLSVRTHNVLHYSDIKTLTELISLSEAELLRLPNFGVKSLREIRKYIAPFKFSSPKSKVSLIYSHAKNRYLYPRGDTSTTEVEV